MRFTDRVILNYRHALVLGAGLAGCQRKNNLMFPIKKSAPVSLAVALFVTVVVLTCAFSSAGADDSAEEFDIIGNPNTPGGQGAVPSAPAAVGKTTLSISQTGTYHNCRLGQQLSEVRINEKLPSDGTREVDGRFSWVKDIALDSWGTVTQRMLFTPTDTTAYNTVTFGVTMIVSEPPLQKGEYNYGLGEKLSLISPSSELKPTNMTGEYSWLDGGEVLTEIGSTSNPELSPVIRVIEFKLANDTTLFSMDIKIDVSLPPEQRTEYNYKIGQRLSEIEPDEALPSNMTGKYVWVAEERLSIVGEDLPQKMSFVADSGYKEEFDVLVSVSMPPAQQGEYVYSYGQKLSDIVPNEVVPENIEGHYEWLNGNEKLVGIGVSERKMVFVSSSSDIEPIVFEVSISVNFGTSIMIVLSVLILSVLGVGIYFAVIKFIRPKSKIPN
jgi:hypothetical protein